MEYINDEAKKVIEQKLKQGKRIEMEYNHQTDELKILEHKITTIKQKHIHACVEIPAKYSIERKIIQLQFFFPQ